MSDHTTVLGGKKVWIPDEFSVDVRERLVDITQKLGGRVISIFDLVNTHYIITSPPILPSPWFTNYTKHISEIEQDEPRPALRSYYWLFACFHNRKLIKSSTLPIEPIFAIDEIVNGIITKKPMKVYVSLNILKNDDEDALTAKSKVISQIECNGGIVFQTRRTVDVLILNLETEIGKQLKLEAQERKMGQKVVEREWVDEKLGTQAQEEKSTEEEEEDKDSFAGDMVMERSRSGKRTRQEFTQEEDDKLARWLTITDPGATKWISTSYYEHLLNDPQHRSWATRHTAESWRERVKKRKQLFLARVDKYKAMRLDKKLRTSEERAKRRSDAMDDQEGRPSKKTRTDNEAAPDQAISHARKVAKAKQIAEEKATALHRAELARKRSRVDDEAEAFGAASDEENEEARQRPAAVQKNTIKQVSRKARSVSVGQQVIDQIPSSSKAANGQSEVQLPAQEPFPMSSPPSQAPQVSASVQVELDSDDERGDEDLRQSMRDRSKLSSHAVAPRVHLPDEDEDDDDNDDSAGQAAAQQFLAGLNVRVPGLERAIGRRARASEPALRLPRLAESRRAKRHSVDDFMARALAAADEDDDEDGDEEEDLQAGGTVPVHLTGQLTISSISVSPRGTGTVRRGRTSVAPSSPGRRAYTPGVARSSPLGRSIQASNSHIRPSAFPTATTTSPPISAQSILVDPTLRPFHNLAGPSRPRTMRQETDLSLVVQPRSETSEAALQTPEPAVGRSSGGAAAKSVADAERRGTANILAKLAHKFGIDPKEFPPIAQRLKRENGGVLDMEKLNQALKELKERKIAEASRS